MNDKYQKLHELYDERGNRIQKLENDKIKLKGHLKVTRQNNEVLHNIVDELKTRTEEIEENLQESMVKIANQTNEIDSMKKTIKDLRKKNKELEKNAEESCRSSDAYLIISQQEIKECNEELEDEVKKNLRCESDKKTCEDKLEDKVQKNKNLKDGYSETLRLLEESRSLSSANQKLAQECKNQLKDEIRKKEVLREKYDSLCPMWSEWSFCSRTCQGVKTRIDRCSSNKEQVEACNQDISCSQYGT